MVKNIAFTQFAPFTQFLHKEQKGSDTFWKP